MGGGVYLQLLSGALRHSSDWGSSSGWHASCKAIPPTLEWCTSSFAPECVRGSPKRPFIFQTWVAPLCVRPPEAVDRWAVTV